MLTEFRSRASRGPATLRAVLDALLSALVIDPSAAEQLDRRMIEAAHRHAWRAAVLMLAVAGPGACGSSPSPAGRAGPGAAGHVGAAGSTNVTGAGATTGAAGDTGKSASGASGAAGSSSATGTAGATNAAGATGTAGAASAAGASGTGGAAGVAGGGSPDGGAGHVGDGGATSAADAGADAASAANTFTDPFDSFQSATWSCEYRCPTVSSGVARFTLSAGAAPDTQASWSKIRYKPRRFTSGRFTVRFALSARPKQAVWWGVALWDDGPAADGSQFNEINFGYTTDESQPDTGLRFESSKHGKGVSLKVDTGVDLYDGQLHTGVLEYDASHVSFFFDGKLLQTITDAGVIPTDPMDFIIGPRLVTGAPSLPADFTESADSAELSW
jgi:hypothetical protein